MSLERKLLNFLQEILEKERIDFIIPVERKGTAVLRVLMEEIEGQKLRWSWDDVLSSTALDFTLDNRLKDKRLLLFDEMVHHGKSLKETKEKVEQENPASILTAAFAVHEKCQTLPNKWFYGFLDSTAYETFREDVVQMLQRYGSLLLDTEHPELKVKVKCSLDEFFSTLAKAGEPNTSFSFSSGTERINFTATKPLPLDAKSFPNSLPRNSITWGVVRKFRVLEGTSHDEFSILPIYYPCIPSQRDDEWIKTIPNFLNNKMLEAADGKQLFYVVGLVAAIKILPVIAAVLYDLRSTGKIILETPKDNLRHLAVMFPTLNVTELRDSITEIVTHPPKLEPVSRRGENKVKHLDEETTIETARKIISCLMSQVDERRTDEFLEEGPRYPIGITWKEIMDLAHTQFMIDPSIASVTVDALIDAGILVTRVEEIPGPDGSPWLVRTFLPDGEIVSSRIRRLASVRGRYLHANPR
jgi:hypothetical protein